MGGGGRGPPPPPAAVRRLPSEGGLHGGASRLAAPGVVVAYERNVTTNDDLEANGVEVLTIPGSRLRRAYRGSRLVGQLMHRGPPRPRPSSLPGMVNTSTPLASR